MGLPPQDSHGFDISREMLEQPHAKSVYSGLHQVVFGPHQRDILAEGLIRYLALPYVLIFSDPASPHGKDKTQVLTCRRV
jgi:hypothetical protein